MSERQNSHQLALPGTETEGDRAERREEAEEKATALRDEKLVDAAGVGDRLHSHVEKQGTSAQKLTVENMGKLDREVRSRSPRSELKKKHTSMTGDSAGAETGTDSEMTDREHLGERPTFERRVMDSERTITGP